jgi:hypothetical protein
LPDRDIQAAAARLAGGVAVAGGADRLPVPPPHLHDKQGVDLGVGEAATGEGVGVL